MPRKSVLVIVLAAALATVAGSALPQQIGIGVYSDSERYVIGKDTLALLVSGYNYGPDRRVDVHIAVIKEKNGLIYEFPDWNTGFLPFLSDLLLPSGFDFPKTQIASYPVGDFPFDEPGRYWFAAAFCEPGSLSFVCDVSFAPFQIVEPSGEGWAVGGVDLAWTRDYYSGGGQVSVIAQGAFARYAEKPTYCAYWSEIPLDGCKVVSYSPTEIGPVESLDAGEYIDMFGSPAGDVRLDKTSDEPGMIAYEPSYPLTEAYYSPGTQYTFVGYGGPDVGEFSASVSAPPTITLYQPSFDRTPVIDRSSDYTVKWEGLASGEIHVTIASTEMDISTMSITIYRCYCRFSDDGEGTIPSDILSQMSPGTWPFVPMFEVSRYHAEAIAPTGLDAGGVGVSASITGAVTLQ